MAKKLDSSLFDEVALRSVAESAPAVEALAKEASPPVDPPKSKPSHELAALFPMMGRADFDRLRASLRERGFAAGEEIILHEGQVLEGRNRLAACEAEGIPPRFKEWQGEGGDPLAFVLLKNLDRRHLTPAQAAAAAAKAAPLFAQAARAKSAPVLDESSPGPKKRNEAGRATAQAAQRFGAGQAATKALQGVLRRAPEVHDLALQGRVTVEDAKRLADLPKADRQRAVKSIKAGAKAKDVLAAAQEHEWEGALTTVFAQGDHVVTDQGGGPYIVISAWTAQTGSSLMQIQAQEDNRTLAVQGEPDGPGRTRAVGRSPKVLRITKEQAAELLDARKEERAERVRQLVREQDEDGAEQRERLQQLAADLRGKSAPPPDAEAQKNLFSSPEPNSAHNVVASQAPEVEAALDAWSQRAKSEGIHEYDQVKLLLHKALALGSLSSPNIRVLRRILQRPYDEVLLHPYEESALWHVLHAKSDGKGGPGTVLARWEELRERGGDDGEVLRALQQAMGPHGKTTGRFVRVEWKGGRSPEVRLYRIGSEEPPWILQGHELLRATRVMLRIPRAGARHAR